MPNSKTKRGWSERQVRWRFDNGVYIEQSAYCGGQLYRLAYDPLRYEWTPEPAIRASILQAIGTQRFWQRWIRRA